MGCIVGYVVQQTALTRAIHPEQYTNTNRKRYVNPCSSLRHLNDEEQKKILSLKKVMQSRIFGLYSWLSPASSYPDRAQINTNTPEPFDGTPKGACTFLSKEPHLWREEKDSFTEVGDLRSLGLYS